MIALLLASLCLAGWWLLTLSFFWTCRERDSLVALAPPKTWPAVVAVVPARNEADVIVRSLASLAAQDYPGPFRIVLVDDNSSDGTGAIARMYGGGRAHGGERVTVLDGMALAPGWTGKLWALHQGIAEAGETPEYLWLTDADIEHSPDTLRSLVTIAHSGNRRLVSLMARLDCEGLSGAALVPAFVWFFMMLYPFYWINRPGPVAGAAGGCILVARETLAKAGGIAAICGALIDDCTLGRLIKKRGPIWLGLTSRSHSIRPYSGLREIGAMIARSAYAQLRYKPALLVLTLAGLALLFAAPPVLLLAGHGAARWLGGIALLLMLMTYQPILRFYHRSPAWALALPVIATFYAGCTVQSALAWYRGKGGMWKGRAQAGFEATP